MKKVLVILGNTSKESFTKEIFKSYVLGAKKKNNVRTIELRNTKFNPILLDGYKNLKLEPSIKKAQKDILWADHLVIIYPVWWMGLPAVLKGFFEKTFVPGFSFGFEKGKKSHTKLLRNKSATIIATQDSKPNLLNPYYKAYGNKVLKKGILEFCGIKPVKIINIGPCFKFNEEEKMKILEKIKELN